MTIKYKILIAEDHALFRAGICALLLAEPDIEIVAEAENGKEVVRLACSLNPDLVLMDLSMPGSNGLEAISEIKKRMPGIKILVVTMHKTDEYIQVALRNGASGYILKEASHDELKMAIRTVLGGKLYLSPDVSERLLTGYLSGGAQPEKTVITWDTLTLREKQVLKLVAEGYGNKHIAEYLCISIKTVEKHRSSLMSKLNLRNASMLTAYAISKGIVSL
ncbi:MAG: response regulator transcription factor [Azonexus sp.]